jgi:hypothetical protein
VAGTDSAAAGTAGAQDSGALATRLIGQLLSLAISGTGPFKGAAAVADEVRAKSDDVEQAVDRLVAQHLRLAAVSGAVTGLGGLATLPVTIPAGVASYFVLAGRLVAGVAHLRGHDLDSEEVRTALLLAMVGAGTATELLRDAGVQFGRHGVAIAVSKVSSRTLTDINKKVGFRLLAKGSSGAVINLGRLVPLVGAPIGAATDVLSIRAVAAYARASFPLVTPASAPMDDGRARQVIEGEVVSSRPAV